MLRRWFSFIGRRAAAQLLAGYRVNLQRFIEPMAQSLLPYIENFYRGGANRARREILIALAKRGARKKKFAGIGTKRFLGPHFRIKRGDPVPQLIAGFDVLNPQVQTAILHHVYEFVRETLNTAETDATEAYEETRRQMMAGLEQGETQREISRRIVGIFAEPMRAFRISTTEASFAVHAGEMEQAKASGVVKKSRWLASADACKICLDLDGKEVELGKPFMTNASKNPKYAVIYHPPAHPHCMCSDEMVVE
jgi:F like protein